MTGFSSLKAAATDLSKHPVEVAENVCWVGHIQENDVFQCHVYLIEQGGNSILFDPCSKLTFAHTLDKIEQIIPFSHIRYFVCHHQDPDIAGALFSSDIFGGFTDEFNLVAKDESYFECLRPFHEHYMPSREILNYALLQLEKHPIKIILPQHGSIIPEHLVQFMITRLKTLERQRYLWT